MSRSKKMEPKATPSVLGLVSEVLRNRLEAFLNDSRKRKNTVMLSSNGLANRIIIERWGIRPSQRKQYSNLFSDVRRHCRKYFRHLAAGRRFCWRSSSGSYTMGVFKFDEVRGNLILRFVMPQKGEEWIVPTAQEE